MQTTQSPARPTLFFRISLGVMLFAVIAMPLAARVFLKAHAYSVFQIAVYFLMVTLVSTRLYACLKLAKAAGRLAALKLTAVWFVFGVIAVASRYEELLRSQNRDYINLVTNIAMLLALLTALQVVESLLRGAQRQATEILPPK